MVKLIFISSALITGTTWGAENNCAPIFINYYLNETIIEEDSAQKSQEHYLINQSGLLQYSKSRVTTGSQKALAVDTYESYTILHNKEIDFPNVKLEKLAEKLKKNGILKIESDNPVSKNADHSNYFATIHYRGYCEDIMVELYNKEASDSRKVITHSIKSFFEEIASESPVAEKTVTSQGDKTTPIEISIAELLKSPEKYNGKRVKTSGYYDLNFESSSLSSDNGKLWLDGPAFFYRKNIDMVEFKQKEISVEGIFFSGKSGHLGGWPGKLSRITNIIEH